MRILLDENVPVELAPRFVGHQADSVVGLGWSGIKNGELLRRAGDVKHDALVTMDTSLRYQQNIAKLPLGVLVSRARSNRPGRLLPLMPAVLAALEAIRQGTLVAIGG